ncbi:phosphonate ABC transporter substrate-binding protein [Chthonobacter albigriseus]|uniref:phosphonate ABC transporter substrate-binding protein n=1 Tax=Chthonobacter albigriseus TaxID=1683161 RepID=UPI0015EED12E|nr:phosphonate ABC transporter substrate-binding protein [Chthonobacter albigriseus]
MSMKSALFGAVALTAALVSGAASAEGITEFRVGILGGENEADRLRNFQCLADHLKTELKVEKVSLFPAADYDGTVQGLLSGTIDYAELGASAYAKVYLADPNAVTPVLTTVQTDGSTGYYSIMVARKDSGIKTLEDAKGKTIGFADPDSTSGYLIPMVDLPKAIKAPIKEYFGESGFGGGHENLVLAVLDKKFEVGTTWGSGVGEFDEGYTSGNLRKMVDKGILDMGDLVEVWRSTLIPNGPVVVRNGLPEDIKAKFVAFMEKLPETDKACFQAIQGGDFTGFTKVDPSFYQTIIDARKLTIGG